MVPVMKFFGYSSAGAFKNDWMKLTEQDREQLKEGVKNGTLTY